MSAGPSWYYGTDPYPGPSNDEPSSNKTPSPLKTKLSDSSASPVQGPSVDQGPSALNGTSGYQFTEDEPDMAELDPSCECGAGTLLGTIKKTPIYSNHRLIDCILKREKPKITYMKQEYFDILQEIVLLSTDTSLIYGTKITKLLQIWKNCCPIFSSHYDPCYGIREFMNLAVSESAVLVLQPEWENIEKEIKNQFIVTVEQTLYIIQTVLCNSDALKMCHCFQRMLRSPWDTEYTPKDFNAKSNPISKICNLLAQEMSSIFIHRLKVLIDTKQCILALKFAKVAIYLYEHFFINDTNRPYFPDNDYECIRDTYYMLLMKYYDRTYIINIFEVADPKYQGKSLVRNFYNKVKYLSSLPKDNLPIDHEITVGICEMGVSMIVANSFKEEYLNKYPDLYQDSCELMRYWIDMVYLLRESQLFTNMETPFYRKTVENFVKWAPTANHLYTLCDLFYDKFGSTLPRTFYINIYARALATNIDEKSCCRLHGTKEKSFKLLHSLVQGYLKLANLLEDVLSVCRECVLTAFTLMPSSDLMVRIENLAIKSGKLTLDDSTNVLETSTDKIKEKSTSKESLQKSKNSNKSTKENTKVFKSDYIRMLFINGKDAHSQIHSELKKLQPEPLTETMINKLINVLRQPRLETLHWNLQWSDMKVICQEYLDNLDVMINSHMMKHEDLKFLNINIAEYNKYAAEMTLQKSRVDQDLSTDSFSEDEKSIKSNSSGEIVSYRLKPSKDESLRKPKVRQQRKKGEIVEVTKPSINVIQSPPTSGKNPSKTSRTRSTKKEFKNSTVSSPSNDETKMKKKQFDVKNKDNLADSTSGENKNVIADKSLIKNNKKAVDFILKGNNDDIMDNNSESNTGSQQCTSRPKLIAQRKKHKGHSSKEVSISKINEYENCDKNVVENIKSPVYTNIETNENVKADQNVKHSVKDSVGSFLDENVHITNDNNVKNYTEPQQTRTRVKRNIKKNQCDDFDYFFSKLSVSTTSQKSEIVNPGKNVLENAASSVDTILEKNEIVIPGKNLKQNIQRFVDSIVEGKYKINTDNNSKNNIECQQNLIKEKRIIKMKQDKDYDYPLSKSSVGTTSQKNEDVNSDENVLENTVSSDTILEKNENENVITGKNVKRKEQSTSISKFNSYLRHRRRTATKRIIKRKIYNDYDYSSSIGKNSKKNKNIPTGENSHTIAETHGGVKTDKNAKKNVKLVDSISKENKKIEPCKNEQAIALFQHKEERPKRLVKKKQLNDYDYSLPKRYVDVIFEKNGNVKSSENLKVVEKLPVDLHTTEKDFNSENNDALQHREKRSITKIQHKEYDYSWTSKKTVKSNKTSVSLNNKVSKDNNVCSTSINKPSIENSNNKSSTLHLDEDHLNELRQQCYQLSTSLEFLVPKNTDHIVNVVQIQTTSNPLTNVPQTQTEHISNHSNNEIEKKTNSNQTNTHSLDNFVSLYQSNSLNNNMNSTQDSGIHQGECSFTGSVSVSNQKITSDSITNLHNISQRETTKPIGSHNVLLDQNSINLNHRCWNDINLQNSGNSLQSTIENAVHVSSNVIVRTSDVINSSVVSHTAQITNATKKLSVKNRDRFIDLTLPASISSISTNSNNCSLNVTNSNKRNFDSKIHQPSPVQTSVGLQVNFNNSQSECVQNAECPNNQSTQICTVPENSTSSNMSIPNDQNVINSISSVNTTSTTTNTSFTKENHILDSFKSNMMSVVNPVSSIQTQTCMDSLLTNQTKVSNPNASVISLMIASTQSQVIKSNVHNLLYTTSQNQKVPHTDLNHTPLQINQSEEQKNIDHLKLSNDKTRTSNLTSFPNATDGGVSNISQENDLLNSKSTNRGRGNMRTYESKTRALKQANMSDMFLFEKGTLYAVQDDIINQTESTKSAVSPKNNTMTTQAKIKNTVTTKESLEKPKLSPNASPNITITGSMLPRFQQVFGKTKFQTSTVINDTSSFSSTNVIPSNTGPIVNQTNLSMSRVYSSSKGVQTNHEIDQMISINSINCITPKVVDNKLQQNITMTKLTNAVIENNKNNVIMSCKAGSPVKNIPQVSVLSSHQTLTSNLDTNIIKKEICGTPTSKVLTFTASCNNLIASSSSNIINSVPIQSDSKSTNNIEKLTQRHLKVPPPIVQTILRRHPNWQQNRFRQGKQSTEVMASSTFERLISSNMSNITKTTIECSNNKVLVSTIKPNITEPNVSSSMMEQVREFESVLEEVRKTSLMNELSTASMLPQINHEIIQIHSPIENVDLLNANSNPTLFPLNEKPDVSNETDRCSFSFLNQTLPSVDDITNEDKESLTSAPTTISVPSVTPVPAVTSPTVDNTENPADDSPQCSNNQIANKSKPVIKTPASSPSISTVKVPVLQQKPLPKLQEDEQTTQRIYAILDKYAEQLRNSPELKNKPAPRRRTNPPTNPSINTKRKKSNQFNLKSCSQQTSCSSSGMEMSPTSDMQALDSEDSSNAVSHFSHIMNSPSGNSDEQNTATVILENPLIENTLLNVHDVINKINVEADIKSQVPQSTQIVMNGTSGSFLSMPESSAANVRLVVAAGKNQKMYRLHCPVTGPGPVLFQQISTIDSCSNSVNISSNISGQNLSESTILSALTSCDLQVPNSGLINEISPNTSKIIDHKTNKSDIILESMEKAQVLDNNEKKLPLYPVMKKSQGSQSTFSVIHPLPKYEPDDKIESLPKAQNDISENTQNNLHENIQEDSNIKEEVIPHLDNDQVVFVQEKLSKTLKDEAPFFIPPGSSESTSITFEDIEFPTFHSQEDQQNNKKKTDAVLKNNINKQNINEIKIEDANTNDTSVNYFSDTQVVSNEPNNSHAVICEDGTIIKQEKSFNSTIEGTSNTLDFPNTTTTEGEEEANKNTTMLNLVATEIITDNHVSNKNKEKEELPSAIVKVKCESDSDTDNNFRTSAYNLPDDPSSDIENTKFLVQSLKTDKTSKNWTVCLSQIMPSGTEKMLEGDNLIRLQELFEQSEIKTFKDFKTFLFEQCKQFDGNVERLNEYNLYDVVNSLNVNKLSPSELFSDVAVIHNLDKTIKPNLGSAQTSTSKSSNINIVQPRRKSVLSHTTTSTVITTGAEQAANVACKKNKSKVSFLKQALYNEMHQDANDCESKHFLNGITKTVFDSMEQIDSGPESPSNTTAVDSETCMSEDSTSTISSGTPHYNFRKSKRKNKNFEEDGFIESQVIKRMYRGRAAEDSEEKVELPKISNVKVQTNEQKSTVEKKETNNRRISSRLKNNNVKNNQQLLNKSPQMDSPPCKITSTRASLRRVSRKTT